MSLTIKDCNWPCFEAFVHVNGDVKPCCYATGAVGSLRQGSLKDIWLGSEMEELRDFVSADKLHPICVGASCVYVKDRLDDAGSVGGSYEDRMRKMAESGSIWSSFAYGSYLLAKGSGNQGVEFIRIAASKGHPGAQHLLATCLLQGLYGVEVDMQEGVRMLRSAAAQKHSAALLLLGELTYNGRYTERDLDAGSALLLEAGERGELTAWAKLAAAHHANPEEARRFLELGKRRGSQDAATALEQLAAA